MGRVKKVNVSGDFHRLKLIGSTAMTFRGDLNADCGSPHFADSTGCRSASTSCCGLRINLRVHLLDHARGIIRKVLRAARVIPLYSMIEPYFCVTAWLGSASSLKFKPSLVQKLLWEVTSSTLTPRITAFFCVYLSRSRWKLCASTVQPEVKVFG